MVTHCWCLDESWKIFIWLRLCKRGIFFWKDAPLSRTNQTNLKQKCYIKLFGTKWAMVMVAVFTDVSPYARSLCKLLSCRQQLLSNQPCRCSVSMTTELVMLRCHSRRARLSTWCNFLWIYNAIAFFASQAIRCTTCSHPFRLYSIHHFPSTV